MDATASAAAAAGSAACATSPVNRGQGAALRLGYWLARARGARVIATLDADGQYEPLELERVVEPILAGRADFVTGSRRLGQRADHQPGAPRRRDRLRRADQRADRPAHHRSRLRAAGDARRGRGHGDARAAAVSGVRADDRRRAARAFACSRFPPRCAIARPAARGPRRAGTSATACASGGRRSAPGAASASVLAPRDAGRAATPRGCPTAAPFHLEERPEAVDRRAAQHHLEHHAGDADEDGDHHDGEVLEQHAE